MGYHAKCPKCAFSLFAGHNHHTGSSTAVCDDCHCFFSCPTNDPWGPEIGERITVCKLHRTGKGRKKKESLVPTGLHFEVIAGGTTIIAGRDMTLAQYPADGLPCPECKTGTIHFGFDIGDLCPWCSKAKLQFSGIIY
jgi:hypothetical protein